MSTKGVDQQEASSPMAKNPLEQTAECLNKEEIHVDVGYV